MPETPRTSRWVLLGRALPKRTRERIFEPALYDMLVRRMNSTSRGKAGFGGAVIALFAGSLAVESIRVLTTRQAILVASALLTVLLLAFVLLNRLDAIYASYE